MVFLPALVSSSTLNDLPPNALNTSVIGFGVCSVRYTVVGQNLPPIVLTSSLFLVAVGGPASDIQ